jgi:thiol-disulfide isomerase/thioredoxin
MFSRMRHVIVCGVVALGIWNSPACAFDPNDSSWSVKKIGTEIDLSWFQMVDGTSFNPVSAGRTILVHVWATWCAPCVAELPSFELFAERMAERGVAVVTLSVDRGGRTAVKPFMDKHHTFAHSTALLDPNYLSGDLWGIRALPTTVLVRDGHEVARLSGKGNWNGEEGEDLLSLLTQLSGR